MGIISSRIKTTAAWLSAAASLAACVATPSGPTVAVMPAPNKPFEVFQQDQGVCTQYASQQVRGGAEQANNFAFGTAVVGTILGAGLGAAIGGGPGAAVGAASGALGGTVLAAGPSGYVQYGLQQAYDMAYTQCMYSKGNQIPGYSYYPPLPRPEAVPPSPLPQGG